MIYWIRNVLPSTRFIVQCKKYLVRNVIYLRSLTNSVYFLMSSVVFYAIALYLHIFLYFFHKVQKYTRKFFHISDDQLLTGISSNPTGIAFLAATFCVETRMIEYDNPLSIHGEIFDNTTLGHIHHIIMKLRRRYVGEILRSIGRIFELLCRTTQRLRLRQRNMISLHITGDIRLSSNFLGEFYGETMRIIQMKNKRT